MSLTASQKSRRREGEGEKKVKQIAKFLFLITRETVFLENPIQILVIL